jgi:hypothetical protein
MALGALSREEPGAAAPAERKSQNKGAPLGSTRWTFPFKSDAMLEASKVETTNTT